MYCLVFSIPIISYYSVLFSIRGLAIHIHEILERNLMKNKGTVQFF